MNDFTLIANSGIHFKTTETEISLDQPLMIQSGKTLKYTFLETKDLINFGQVKLDICSLASNQYATVKYLDANNLLEKEPNGLIALDECGVPKIKQGTAMGVQQTCAPNDPRLMNINSLSALRFNIKKTDEDGMVVMDSKTGFELLLGKWLPMPMYEYDENNVSTKYPNGWCRVRIDELGESGDGQSKRYRLTWAFDTQLAKDAQEGKLRPAFLAGNDEKKLYKICNRPDLLLGEFLNIPDGQNDAPIGTYLASLWGIDLSKNLDHKYKFLAYYIYLINYLRLSGAAPDVILYHKTDNQIPVDMSIDIGNSRTCAVLFENGLFDKAKMLRIRDLSQPWKSYENAFDMRIVFRKADFGGDITMGKDLFQWKSLVRVGEEAKHLVYHSLEGNNESRRTTNHSSPKRYLWDDRLYDSRWELMVEEDDPTNVKVAPQIYTKGFTDYFDNDGTFLGHPKKIDLFQLGQNNDKQCHYSRRSLMTFVMVEILQHALNYINSSQFRELYSNIDCYRYLRNIIVTCPTAMPLEEQHALRKAAKDASDLMHIIYPSLPIMTITPNPDVLLPVDNGMQPPYRGWLYDEAFASQLVFLYAELSERYGGKVDHFFNLKGHLRTETNARYRLHDKSLTIGTVDIGAGTTDVMITVYGQNGMELVPVPLFYDSFYTAGDDIMHNIIGNVILEGGTTQSPNMGSISSVLNYRIQRMTPDEILSIKRVAETKEYRESVEEIRNAASEEEATIKKSHLVNELMHHFFAGNSAGMSEKDRRCRLDFCTQVTQPLAQFFLELLKLRRPSHVYSFDEIFPNDKPSTYLLDHFKYHFGFSFTELLWCFDPDAIAEEVRKTMITIVKPLAEIVFRYNCDFLVLSGRPTSLKPLTELFLENIPVAPNRIVCLNSYHDKYHVGRWFPLATQEGYFQENQKAVVAVGAEVGYLASTVGFHGLVLDFSVMNNEMKSTAKYMGFYDEHMKSVSNPFLTPQKSTALLNEVAVFPCYIGVKQYNSPKYPARPLYALYNNSNLTQINVSLQRDYFNDREKVWVDEARDKEGKSIAEQVDFRMQTLASEGNFWMDKGAFTLKIQVK